MKFYNTIYLLSLAFFSFGQESMTLEKALSIGLENNYGIKIADQYIEIAENNNTWALAGRTLTIDLLGNFTNNLTKDNNPASFLQGTYYNGSLGASANANYVVYNGGRIKLNKEQLMLAVDQQRLNKSTDIHSLFRSIFQQYYEVIFQKEQLKVLNQVLTLSQDRLDYENTKRAYGSSNTYNIIQFESALIADSNSIITQAQNIVTAKRNLYNTLDISGSADYIFKEQLSITTEAIDEDRLKTLMSEENYTIKSLNMIAMLNQLNTGLAKAATKPVVSLNGSIGFAENGFKFFADNPQTGEPFDFQLSNRFTGGLGATVSYNLYDGGVRKTNIQNAEITEQIDQLNILEAKAALGNQLDILIANYQNQLDILAMTDRQIDLAQQNIEITEERFKSGQVTSLDFRNVQNQFLNAAYSKVGAIYALLVTKSEIDFLVGVFEE